MDEPSPNGLEDLEALNLPAERGETETFLSAGECGDVVTANINAWASLVAVIGTDDVDSWELKKVTHTLTEPKKITWQAVFERITSHLT